MSTESSMRETLPSPLRRRLLQAGLSLSALAALEACGGDEAPAGYGHSPIAGEWRNWSGGQRATPARFVEPQNEDELIKLLRETREPLRVAGAGHSFSPLVNTEATLVSLDELKGIIDFDVPGLQANIWAGTRLRDLGAPLDALGQGLVNQGDIDTQALAGAVGTATHGTGITLGSFSSMVGALRLVTAEGQALDCSREQEPELLRAAACSFGALGVLTRIRLQNRAAYKLKERTFGLPLRDILDQASVLREENRHFEFWVLYDADFALVKTLEETEESLTRPESTGLGDRLFWAAVELAHHFPSITAKLQQVLVDAYPAEGSRVGWSHRIFPSVRDLRFNEMEYQVPVERGLECLMEVRMAARKAGVTTLFPIEFRYVAADDCYLSPFAGRESCSISIHQYHRADWRPLFAVVEPILQQHGGRPHWGKLHTMNARQLAPLYPDWDRFQDFRKRLDPHGRFLNPHLRALFGVS